MVPTLVPGQTVLVDLRAYRSRDPHPGDIVLLRHPRDPELEKVKRVRSLEHGGVFVVGDNSEGSTDSRHFGPVSPEGILGRVVCTFALPN